MKIVYTNYAEETLIDREISKYYIQEAILYPYEVVEGNKGRKIAHKISGDKLLRVIFEVVNTNVYIVITAYFTKPERYLKK